MSYNRDMTDEMVILTRTHCASPAQCRATTNSNFLKTSEILDETWQLLQSFAINNANIFERGRGRFEAIRKSRQLWKGNKIERTKAAHPAQGFLRFHQIKLGAVINTQSLECAELICGGGKRNEFWTVEDAELSEGS